jgi:phage shock protein A
MGLFQRIGDIISANLNEMVERFEGPELMLKQAVREMESAIEEARLEAAQAMASSKLAHRRLAEQQRQADDGQRRAEQAVRAGDDPLARQALARRGEALRLVAALTDQAAAADEAAQALRRRLAAMQAKRDEARRRLDVYCARARAADLRARVQSALAAGPADPDAFAAFDRLRARVERAEAEAEALRELDETLPTAPRPAAARPRPNDVGADLAELKRKLGT